MNTKKFKHLDWIGFALTMLGIYFNANKIIWCWPIWLGSNVFWTAHFAPRKERAAIMMNIGLVIFSIYGWYQWLS